MFLADYANSIVPQRLALLGAAIVLVGTTPLVDAWFLHPPAAFVGPTRWVQFGIMIPALLLAALATSLPSLRRWANPVGLAAAFAMACGVMFQRALGAVHGFNVPAELVGVVFAGTAILSGFRLVHSAPLAGVILLLFVLVEIRSFGSNSSSYYAALAMGMLAVISIMGAYLQEYAARAGWLQRRMLEELALQDSLTGLSNFRGFHTAYRTVFGTALRDGRPLLVAAIDIDHFKAYNDYYGHPAGDDCLRRVAEVLARHTRRAADIKARTGGEEFMLVRYDVSADAAAPLLEQVRAEVQALAIPHAASPQAPVVTISIGAACQVPDAQTRPEGLLQAADDQLYLSKQNGRNRVSLQVSSDPLRVAAQQLQRPGSRA